MMTDDQARSNPIPAFRTLREAGRLLRKAWLPVLIYGVASSIIVGIVLSPFLFWILAGVLSLARSDVVLNYDLKSLAISLDGIALGLLWVFAVSLIGVLMLGGVVLITSAAFLGRKVSLQTTARRVFGTFHRVPGVGALKFTLWFFLLAPLIAGAGTALIALLLAPFGAGPVEHWVPKEVTELAWIVPAGIVLLCAAYVFYVRWCFSLHYLVLERVSLTEAIKRSTRLVGGSFRPLARVLLLHNLVIGLFVAAVTLLLGFVDWLVLGLAPAEQGTLFRALVSLLLVFNGAAIGATTIIAWGFGIALVTVLFFRLQGGQVELDLRTDELSRQPRTRRRRALAIALVLIAVGIATALTAPKVREELAELVTAVKITAHRGSAGEAPENTLAAVQLAIKDGAHVAEFDVQEAKDGTIVLHHDLSLRRVAGVNRGVWEMTLEELRTLDVGSWFDQRFAGERIPTLDEVLALARGRINVNIELKMHGREQDYARAVVDAIHRHGFADDCVITSLDYDILQQVRKLDPDLRLGIIVAATIGRVERLDVDFYSVQPNLASVAFIRNAHANRREVHVWSLTNPIDMERFMDRGVDNIITSYPRRAIAILEERTEADELAAAIARLFQR